MSQLCQPLAPGYSTPAPTISSCFLISPLVFVSHRKMFLPFRHNQRGKCLSLSLSPREKGGLGNRGRNKAAWLIVPLGNGPKSQGFLLRLWVTERMGWGEEADPSFLRRPRQTNKAAWRQQVFLSRLVNCTGSGLGLWGVVTEWESKPLSEARLIVRMSTAPGRWSQDQGYRTSFKVVSFVKHSKKCSSDCSPGRSHPAAWLNTVALRPKSQLE